MRSITFISVLCLFVGWSYGVSSSAGSFSYGDASGNRYGGTYGSNHDQGFGGIGYFPPFMPNFWSNDDFFPDYFRNLEVLLRDVNIQRTSTSQGQDILPPLPALPRSRSFHTFPPLRPFFHRLAPFPPFPPLPPLDNARAFQSNLENQRRAYTAAKKAFDLASNQAGYIPNFTTRYNYDSGFGADDFLGFRMPGRSAHSAFAGGAVGPDFTHQIAAINPKNPNVQNVNVMSRFADTARAGDNDYYSVSSSSFVSSSNVDGKEKSHKKAETVVNRNGEITKYKVEE